MILLPEIIASSKSGAELFHVDQTPLKFSLKEFWRWSASDLMSNATRGVLAEFLVARAIGVNPDEVRHEWDAYDLTSPSGIKIEVKSSAYIQSWYQENFSEITFSIKPARAWDSETNKLSENAGRHADVYVFALLAHQDQDTIDPMDVSQWEFYTVPTSDLNTRKRNQHSITLGPLKLLAGETLSYHDLAAAVELAGQQNGKPN